MGSRLARFSTGCRTLVGIVEHGLERRRRFQRLEERDHVDDVLVAEHAVAAPGRHHRVGIIDALVVNGVEEMLVRLVGIADLGEIGADIARQVGAAGRTHHVAGQTRAAARAVGDKLVALGRIAGERRKLARLLRRRRRIELGQRVPFRLVALGPAGIALIRQDRCVALEFERRQFLRRLRIGRQAGCKQQGAGGDQCSGGNAARQNPSTRHELLPEHIVMVRASPCRRGRKAAVVNSR